MSAQESKEGYDRFEDLQKEQDEIDLSDGALDAKISLNLSTEQQEELRRTYIEKLNTVIARLRRTHEHIDRQKDAGHESWPKWQREIQDTERSMLVMLYDLNDKYAGEEYGNVLLQGVAGFNAEMDEAIAEIVRAEKTHKTPESKEKNTPQPVSSIFEEWEVPYKGIELQGKAEQALTHYPAEDIRTIAANIALLQSIPEALRQALFVDASNQHLLAVLTLNPLQIAGRLTEGTLPKDHLLLSDVEKTIAQKREVLNDSYTQARHTVDSFETHTQEKILELCAESYKKYFKEEALMLPAAHKLTGYETLMLPMARQIKKYMELNGQHEEQKMLSEYLESLVSKAEQKVQDIEGTMWSTAHQVTWFMGLNGHHEEQKLLSEYLQSLAPKMEEAQKELDVRMLLVDALNRAFVEYDVVQARNAGHVQDEAYSLLRLATEYGEKKSLTAQQMNHLSASDQKLVRNEHSEVLKSFLEADHQSAPQEESFDYYSMFARLNAGSRKLPESERKKAMRSAVEEHNTIDADADLIDQSHDLQLLRSRKLDRLQLRNVREVRGPENFLSLINFEQASSSRLLSSATQNNAPIEQIGTMGDGTELIMIEIPIKDETYNPVYHRKSALMPKQEPKPAMRTIAHRDKEGVVRLLNGTVVDTYTEYFPYQIKLAENTDKRLLYLSPEAEKIVREAGRQYPEKADRLMLSGRPHQLNFQLPGSSLPPLYTVGAQDLSTVEEHDGKFIVKDTKGNTLRDIDADAVEIDRASKTRQVLRTIDTHPTVASLGQQAGALRQNLRGTQTIMQTLFDSESVPSEAMIETFKNYAGDALDILTDPSVRRDVDSMRTILEEQLSKLDLGTFEGRSIERELRGRLDALAEYTAVLDNNSLINSLQSALKVRPATWAYWRTREGLIMAGAIVVACTAIVALTILTGPGGLMAGSSLAAVMSTGATANLLVITGVGTAAGMAGAAGTQELLYQLNNEKVHGKYDTLSGSRTGNYFLRDTKLYDPKTDEFIDMAFIKDLASPIAQEFCMTFATTAMALGAASVAGPYISKLAQSSKFMKGLAERSPICNKIFIKLSTLGTAANTTGTVPKSLAHHFVQLLKEIADEFSDEAVEAALGPALARIDHRLQFLTVFLVATGKGIKPLKTGNFEYSTQGKNNGVDNAVQQAEEMGYTVERTLPDGRIQIRNFEDASVMFMVPEVSLSAHEAQLADGTLDRKALSLRLEDENIAIKLFDELLSKDGINERMDKLLGIEIYDVDLSMEQKLLLLLKIDEDALTVGQKRVILLTHFQPDGENVRKGKMLRDAGFTPAQVQMLMAGEAGVDGRRDGLALCGLIDRVLRRNVPAQKRISKALRGTVENREEFVTFLEQMEGLVVHEEQVSDIDVGRLGSRWQSREEARKYYVKQEYTESQANLLGDSSFQKPYQFQAIDQSILQHLYKTIDRPIETLQMLQQAGITISIKSLREGGALHNELIQTPQLLRFVESVRQVSPGFAENVDSDDVGKLCAEARNDVPPGTTLAALQKLPSHLQGYTQISSVSLCRRIVEHEEIMQILWLLGSPDMDDAWSLLHLSQNEPEKVTTINRLLALNEDLRSNSIGMLDSWLENDPFYKECASNAHFLNISGYVRSIFGSAAVKKDAELKAVLVDHGEQFAVFFEGTEGTGIHDSIASSYRSHQNTTKNYLVKIVSDSEKMDQLAESAFQDFARRLHGEQGCHLNLTDLVGKEDAGGDELVLGYQNSLIQSWKNETLRHRLLEPDVRVIAYLTKINYLSGLEMIAHACDGKEYPGQALMMRIIQNGIADHLIHADQKTLDFVRSHIDEISHVPAEHVEAHIKVLERMEHCPSQELQKVKTMLVRQLVVLEDPINTYERIEEIFLRNHLPLVGKIYLVFEILYPEQELNTIINYKENISPFLRQASDRQRYRQIYRDLIRIHIESASPSLQSYLHALQAEEEMLVQFLENDLRTLSSSEKLRIAHALSRFEVVCAIRDSTIVPTTPNDILAEGNFATRYQNLRSRLNTREGQSLADRVVEKFARALGYHSVEDLQNATRDVKTQAHNRGLAIAKEAQQNALTVQQGDFLKGVNAAYIANVLENGATAPEYLGVAAGSDVTPFDTDVAVVDNEGGQSLETILEQSAASSYGKFTLAVRNRGQLQYADRDTTSFDHSRLEVFQTDTEQGVRTGFGSTHIDFIICRYDLENETDAKRHYYDLTMTIARNGWYIPIVDTSGKLLFTPDDYTALRNAFRGVDRFGGENLDVVERASNVKNEAHHAHEERVSAITADIAENQELVAKVSAEIEAVLQEVLQEAGIDLKPDFDRSVGGARLYDIGSTGRGTNSPGDYDFDFTLRLDDAHSSSPFFQSAELVEKVRAKLGGKDNGSHALHNDGQQLRLTDCELSSAVADVDIAFISTSDIDLYATHNAVSDRLEWIRTHHGQNAYERTVANILVAKQILKAGQAYKRVEHGGWGGVGTENWILANGGNFLEACRTFWDVAHTQTGQVVPFDEFVQSYPIINPGVNLRDDRHDNYTRNMNEKGYQAMLKVIGDYLGVE